MSKARLELIDRALVKRWSLTELSAILEPTVSFRVLTSWISGKPLHIKPALWKPEHFPGMIAVPDRKPDKRARYGFPNLLQFILARDLFAEKVSREVIQKLCDHIAADRTTLRNGYYLVLTGTERQEVFFFHDKDSLVAAIRDNPVRLPQFLVFDFMEVVDEAFSRIEAWESRRPHVTKTRESVANQATSAWVERNAGNLVAAIERHSRSKE